MKIVNLSLCTFAALIFCLAPASAQRMPQDYWYLHEIWDGPGGNLCAHTNGLLFFSSKQNTGIVVLRQDHSTAQFFSTTSSPTDLAIGKNGLIYFSSAETHNISAYSTYYRKIRLDFGQATAFSTMLTSISGKSGMAMMGLSFAGILSGSSWASRNALRKVSISISEKTASMDGFPLRRSFM